MTGEFDPWASPDGMSAEQVAELHASWARRYEPPPDPYEDDLPPNAGAEDRPRDGAGAGAEDRADPESDGADSSGSGLDLFRLDWHALWGVHKPIEWIAEPLLPAGRHVALYSPPKAGKTLLVQEIGGAVVTGGDVLGHPTQRRRVLYVDFENDPDQDIRTRFDAMGYAPHQLDDLVYLSFPVLGPLDGPAGGRELAEYAIAERCEAVIIDTVSRSVGGSENDNDTWLAFYRFTGLRLKQAGISLLRLDHTGKDPLRGQRGGSAKSGDVDAVWSLLPAGDNMIRLSCDGARFPIITKELVLARRTNPLRHEVLNATDSPGAAQLVADLERLGVDPRWGKDKAREALREAGIKASNTAIVAAQRARRNAEIDVEIVRDGFSDDD